MILDVLCRDGSPLGVCQSSIHGMDRRIGVGGSELALLTMCELWTNQGHKVRLYNDPDFDGYSEFEQLPIVDFIPSEHRDVLINFRTPNPLTGISKGLKVWWSCDQFTMDDYAKFSKKVDRIVCISDFHKKYFEKTYGINNSIVIDIPVRLWEYERTKIERVKNRLIYNSVPGRGLHLLRRIWPILKEEIPDLSLTITSDYRLWGVHDKGNFNEVTEFYGWKDVEFLGAIKRDRLVIEELKASVQAYTCLYEELFCISTAECEVAGAYPVTTDIGALATTNMGRKIKYHAVHDVWLNKFVDAIIDVLQDPDLETKRNELQKKAIARFSPDNILKQWEQVFR